MSDYSRLIINGQEAYRFLDDELPINLKLRIENLDGDTAGSFARSKIDLPATKNNKLLFKDSKFQPFYIENNTGAQYVGVALLVDDNQKDNCYLFDSDKLQVELILNNSTWINDLRGCKISELIPEVVTYDQPTIIDATFSQPEDRNYGFGWIKRYEWEKKRNVDEREGIGTVNRVLESPSLFDTDPLYFISVIIKEAFKKIGYTVESEFIDSDFFRRLVLPLWIPDKMPIEYSEEYLNVEVYKDVINVTSTPVPLSPVPYDTVISAPTVGANPYSTVTFQYTAPAKGYYEVTVEGTYDPNVSGVFNHLYLAKVEVISGGLAPVPPIGFGTGSSVAIPAGFPTGRVNKSTGVIFVDVGAVIQVTHVHSSDVDFDVLDNRWTIVGEAVVSEGFDIPLRYLARDWEVLPMLKDLKNQFQLRFETNEKTKTVKIEPVDRYRYTQRGYNGGSGNTLPTVDEVRQGFLSSGIVDWSGKVDLNKQIKKMYKQPKGRLSFAYAEDAGDTLNFLNAINDPKVLDAYYDLLDTAYDQSTKRYTTEFFTKIIHVSDTLARFPNQSDDPTIINNISSTIVPQMPIIYNSDYNYPLDPTAPKSEKEEVDYPVLLYFGGQRGGIDGFIEIAEAEGQFFVLPALFAVNYNDDTGLDACLSWSNENNNLSEGLLKRYHSAELARYRNGVYLSLFVCLNSVEINNITLGQRIYINSLRYIIKDIEIANPNSNESVKVLLKLDANATQDDIDRILGSGINAVVQAI